MNIIVNIIIVPLDYEYKTLWDYALLFIYRELFYVINCLI